MTSLCLALLLLASPEPLTFAMPAFEASDLPAEEVAYWSAVFANGLRQQGIKVVAADAEAPDGTVRGELTRVAQSGARVDLRVLQPDGRALAAFSMTAQSQGEISEVLQRAAQELAGELYRRTQRVPSRQKAEPLPPAPAAPVSTKLKPGVGIGIALALLGAGALGGGAYLLVTSRSQLSAVARGEPASYFAAQQQAQSARDLSIVSVVLLGTGGVLAAGGIFYALYSGRVNTFFNVSAMLAPGGGGLSISGAFP